MISLLFFLADVALPDPTSNTVAMWFLGGLITLTILIGGVASAIVAVLAIIDRIGNKPTKVQADVSASNEGPGRVEFDLHVNGLREDLVELKAVQKETLARLEIFGGDQYRARGRMHRKLNRLENAMHFWAGKLAGQGDEDAKRLQAIIESGREGDEETE